jgi:cathepsin L
MKVTITLLGLVALCSLASADETWSKFKSGKKFVDKSHEEKSKEQFIKNKKFVEDHNSKPSSFEVEINEFADLDTSQLKFSKGLKRPKVIPVAKDVATKLRGPAPKKYNWVDYGAVTPVQNQGSVCGSCYTFSATGALEGALYMKYRVPPPKLSEQSFIDCSGGAGCDGGLPQNIFNYIKKGGLVNYANDYGYKEKKTVCQYQNFNRANLTVKGLLELVRGDEDVLKNALFNHGPVAMGIDAGHPSFQFYKRGVYYEPDCKNGFYDLDHAMLLVGYDTTPEGEDYWIIKNSWGPNWGVNGYFWLTRDGSNHCGVATDGVIPLLG